MSTWVIKDADGNITNPGIEASEEFVAANFDHYEAYVRLVPSGPNAQEKLWDARSWRDMELARTDFILPLSDHPQRAAYMDYRVELRDWPSTSDFPDTKPELGS